MLLKKTYNSVTSRGCKRKTRSCNNINNCFSQFIKYDQYNNKARSNEIELFANKKNNTNFLLSIRTTFVVIILVVL